MMLDRPAVEILHNIEVAHRLSLTPGKCEQIHGHSMWVTLRLFTQGISSEGIAVNYAGDPFEFGELKAHFRRYLDRTYDHHLLLNENDPWAGKLTNNINYDGAPLEDSDWDTLPGLATLPGDPTTENLAKWIADWASEQYGADAFVRVRETAVNAATALSYARVDK